eukprot:3528515-Alexandrium_andersonii.AAC.1
MLKDRGKVPPQAGDAGHVEPDMGLGQKGTFARQVRGLKGRVANGVAFGPGGFAPLGGTAADR